jgi:lambda repressor-like predicted transcriptional regulator
LSSPLDNNIQSSTHFKKEKLCLGRIKTEAKLLNSELADFLTHQCEERGLSLRSLSMNAGLSSGTVHNIIRRKYKPNVSSLNALADYLSVKREYLWQMAGLLEDMDYSTETTFSDPQVRFHFAQVDKLPKEKRNIILSVIEALIVNLKSEDSKAQPRVSEAAKSQRKYKSRSSED